MLIAPPIYLSTRAQSENSRGELALRYVAATTATLLAIGGAQLMLPNSFIWMLAALTLTGVPVSIFLRLNDMKIGLFRIPRPLWNSLTVLATFGTASYTVFYSMRDFLVPLFTGRAPHAFWESFGPSEPVQLLMQVFLLFAAFRSFAIISDKDATLTAVPSFSVLLLLIPLHHSLEVMLYFVAWMFVAATLFALDHRSEVRAGAQATVPSIVPGQDVRLGARSLVTVLFLALSAAVGVSIFLTSRDPSERSSAETAISGLASRLTRFVLSMPETAVNSGPERQIDFTAGPPLPSRTVLWQVAARAYGGKELRPSYWRLFALNVYNGRAWSQGEHGSVQVPRTLINYRRWPPRDSFYPANYREVSSREYDLRVYGSRADGLRDFSLRNLRPLSLDTQFFAYDVEQKRPEISRQFGTPAVLVRQNLVSHVSNIGFIPVQPGVRAVLLADSDQKEVRVRRDGAIDVGFVQIGQTVRVLSEIPALPEYGIARSAVPNRQLSAAQIASTHIALEPAQRAANLQLPPTLPLRVRHLGRAILKKVPANGSNYLRAQRLALALQENAVYTLRPPSIPAGRDATDYFLFDGARRGYCTYFAGALTVLCRTQGIPARVVSGFAGAQWDGSEAGLLRDSNAHAWTEVWVDGFGWAVVDATPTDDRGDNSPAWVENWGDFFASTFNNALLRARDHLTLLAFASTVLLALIFGLQKRRNRLALWSRRAGREEDSERRAVYESYRRIARAMSRKFRPKSHWETPEEWLQSCAATLSRSDAEELRRLTALYLAARYSQCPLPPGSAKLAQQSAARIGWKQIRSS